MKRRKWENIKLGWMTKNKSNLSSKINKKGNWDYFLISIKKVYNTPTLPKWVIDYNKKLYVRIFRVMGLYSTSAILLNANKDYHVDYPLTYYLILVIIEILYFIYNIWIGYHRFKEIKRVIKNRELEIKN